jgi:hypothetical protein
MLVRRVRLMESLFNSTKAITVAVVFLGKVRISYQKTKYHPNTDILRVHAKNNAFENL